MSEIQHHQQHQQWEEYFLSQEQRDTMSHSISALKDYELAGDAVLHNGHWYQPYYLSSGWVEFHSLDT